MARGGSAEVCEGAVSGDGGGEGEEGREGEGGEGVGRALLGVLAG